MGTVYLLHFSKKYHHAGHYIGFTKNLTERIEQHKAGAGARLLEVIVNAGITFDLVRTWAADRKFERKLKRRKKAAKLCPICRKEMGLP